MGRLRFLAKNTGILAVSNFASKILVFLLVPLYTRILSTSDVGLFDLIVSTVTLLAPVLTCNISEAVMRFSMDENCSKADVARIGLKYTAIGTIIGWLLLLLIKLGGWWPALNGFEFYIAIYFLLFSFNQYLIQAAKGNEKVLDLGISGIIGTICTIVFVILFLVVLEKGLSGFFLANIMSQSVSVVYLFLRVGLSHKSNTFLKANPFLEKEMLIYSVPLIATTLGWWVNSTLDHYIVAGFCGVDANGLLSVAYKIPSIINVVQGIFIQAWQISAIKEYESGDKAYFYGRGFLLLNTVMSLSCAVLLIITKPVSYILFGGEFYLAWAYVPFLLISCVLNTASGFLGPILSAKKDTKSLALSAVVGSLINTVLNVVLVLFMGIQGACIATAISSLSIYIYRKIAVKKDIDIANYKSVYLTWIVLSFQACVEIYTPFWYVEIVLMVLLLFINKDSFISIIRMINNILSSRRKRNA